MTVRVQRRCIVIAFDCYGPPVLIEVEDDDDRRRGRPMWEAVRAWCAQLAPQSPARPLPRPLEHY